MSEKQLETEAHNGHLDSIRGLEIPGYGALAFSRWTDKDAIPTSATAAAVINLALESGDVDEIYTAIDRTIRALGVTEISKVTGLSRTQLYKTFHPGRDPSFRTVMAVMNAIEVRLRAVPSEYAMAQGLK